MPRSVFARYSPLLLVAAIWEAAPRLGLVNPEILPPLSTVLGAVVGLARDGDLAYHGWSSLLNLVAGLGLGIVVGVVLGVLMAWYRPIEALVNPLVRVLYPLPRSALIPVMILWFGLGAASKIAELLHFQSGVTSASNSEPPSTTRDEPTKRRRGSFMALAGPLETRAAQFLRLP